MSRNIHESAGRIWVRLALFILFFIAALWGIGNGVSLLATKQEGYYEITVDSDDDVPFFKNGIVFMEYLGGSNSQVKGQLIELKALYRQYLLMSYKLLDTEIEYPGYVNFATINNHLGEELTVTPEFFQILKDLWKKTQENNGVNMFAGSLQSTFDTVLSLTDMSDFSYETNPDFYQRLKTVARETANLSHFNIEFNEQFFTVIVTVSGTFQQILKETEFSDRILSAGKLKDAYRLDLIRNGLESHGYGNGYISADSGLVLSLKNHSIPNYLIYDFENGLPVQKDSITGGNNTAFSFLRTFPLIEDEILYHNQYHPNYRLIDMSYPDLIIASGIVNRSGDIVQACYENISLYQAESPDALEKTVSGISDDMKIIFKE